SPSLVLTRPPPRSTLFPYTTLFRSLVIVRGSHERRDYWYAHLRSPGACARAPTCARGSGWAMWARRATRAPSAATCTSSSTGPRSEEHTSELQSQSNLVCRLLLEKK